MKVTTYIINEGTDDQIIFLVNAKDGTVVKNAPNDWKTERGAIRWSLNNGFEFVPEREADAAESEQKSGEMAETIRELQDRITGLEEKLRKQENAWAALRKILFEEEK